ncbi:potassium transporter TrkA, partial [Streptomyces sp. SID5910]|nr:potassium transporter TrkA [Streptomyces sp. SID5910]
GAWRVLALEVAGASGGEQEGGVREPRLVWDLPGTYVLRGEDRVVLAATRRGLAELLGRRAVRRADV